MSAPRTSPECLVLAPRPGAPPSDRPPVRIFLGSEPAQWRAERVFVWSIERVRDPGRRYEIYVMKELAGFSARRWTTGFTQYRFAIPHFGRSGRAIYNDTDQVYLSDPALLFDAELGSCGYRSVSPDDTSVMLLDCDRMREHWTLERAQRESKRRLHARARAAVGLWGPLDPAWNARDDEAVGADAHLIHFTTLHTQPWRPFPERFAYQPNPVGEIWHALEADADAHDFWLEPRRGARTAARWTQSTPPRVWVLRDDRPGNATQAIGLAEALAWPYEVKQLRCRAAAALHNRWLGASLAGIDRDASSALEPPWPDLVIAAGRRTAPVAQWIREQSNGCARVVALGRKAGDDAEQFDLVVTPSYARLFPHPRRIETSGPIHRVTRDALAKARDEWADRLGDAPAPRIAVLVGGTSGQYRLGIREAAELGAASAQLARACGGSLFATTSRRLGPAATEAFCAAIGPIHFLHRWTPDDPSNPYLGLLAHADAFVITGDSESMLAEATSLGRPVAVYPLPVRRSFRWLSASREWVVRRATAKPRGPRGTPRPQRGLERWCGKAIERGYVRPPRDLDRLHAALFERGVAHPFTGALPLAHRAAQDDRAAVAAAVREMMGVA